ncbi:MAG: eukaryotic-like serine/threonine-protein kinase [Blastocatellia bacterium]|jgi:serine/threonine-protein kinase|nr:eukaryotic-like serine/threonine-protein kinase [Blastocatellia bacterium]
MKKCPQCGKEYQDTNTLCPNDGTVLEKDGDGLIGQTLANKYRIEELINEGGMGAVYRGTHILMEKTVAVKVLHPALAADDTIVARFSREAKAASRISHPHALNVTDFGESDNGVVFLVMEYLHGKTLKEVIHEAGPMPLARVNEIIRQVCGALEAAHGEGVVHRDLKSDNIMLVDVSGGGDWAKVLDFGIAKITEKVGQDPALTAPNLIIGTPQYMSPEQCSQASEIDSRSDIYSLGVILFEMLSGHVPFTGESPTAIMMKHLQDAPPSILEERQDLPAAVGRVVARALAKRPEDRYQTVSELSESLAEAAEEPAGVAAATSPGVSERDTNRIVVPTGSNEPPRSTVNDDYDEATVVRKRPAQVFEEPELFRDEIAPPPESVNIWKIIIPAAAALLVLFSVIYALTGRNSTPAANDNTMTLDPAGQPVQPAAPVTGKGEQGISPNAPANTASGGTTTQPEQPGMPPTQNAGELPAGGNLNGNRNANQSQNDNANNQADDEPPPTPTPAKNNNGRNETPAPQTSPTPANDSDEPPPLPTPKPKPKTKPTPPPAETTPKTPPGAGSDSSGNDASGSAPSGGAPLR